MPKADVKAGEIPVIDESCSKRATEDINEAIDARTWIDETKYDSCTVEQRKALGLLDG